MNIPEQICPNFLGDLQSPGESTFVEILFVNSNHKSLALSQDQFPMN